MPIVLPGSNDSLHLPHLESATESSASNMALRHVHQAEKFSRLNGLDSSMGSKGSPSPSIKAEKAPIRRKGVRRVQRSMSFIGLVRDRPPSEARLALSSGPVRLHLKIEDPSAQGKDEGALSISRVSVSLLVLNPMEEAVTSEGNALPGLEASRDAITGRLIRRDGSDTLLYRSPALPAYLPSINSMAASSSVATIASRTTNNSFKAWATVVTSNVVSSPGGSDGGSVRSHIPGHRTLLVRVTALKCGTSYNVWIAHQ